MRGWSPSKCCLSEYTPVPRQVNYLEPIAGPHAAQHAVDMVLYGLLGKVQVRSDFFICQPLGNQGDQLLLPACQAQFEFNSRAGNGRPLPRYSLEQRHGKLRRAYGLPLRHGADRRDDIGGRGIFEQIPHGARSNAFQKNLWIVVHIDEEDLNVRGMLRNFGDQCVVRQLNGDRIQNQDMRTQRGDGGRYFRHSR